MPLQDRLERRLVAPGQEPLQELRLAQPGDRPRLEEPPQRPDHRTAITARHAPGPPSLVAAVTRYECSVGDDRSRILPEISHGSRIRLLWKKPADSGLPGSWRKVSPSMRNLYSCDPGSSAIVVE